MPTEIRRVTETFLHNPEKVEVSKPPSTAVTVIQSQVSTGREPHEKRETLRRLLHDAKDLKNAIIFCNRKREVALLHRSLQKHGFSVAALHGDMDQSARTAALDQFRKGELPLLVASDVAARGLDIPEVSHVFNFDVPHHPDDYVHRVGRTGRAGRSGIAISIVTSADHKSIAAIERLIGQPIPRAEIAASDITPTEAAAHDSSRANEGATEHRERDGRKPRRRSRRSGEGHAGESRSTSEGRPPRQGRSGEGRSTSPRPQVAAAAISEAPSIGRALAPQPKREPASEPADHSHLPAFLLRPIRARG
jgi:superfamily II DNA/RNA helicase